jgi:hypothetical protein
MEKQIEEMAMTPLDVLANDIYQHCPDLAENYCGDTHCVACLAEALYNAGYRKQSENIIVLPCKVGDMVYLPWEWKDTSGIAILTVERISITEAGQSIRTDFWSDDENYWLAYNCGVFRFDDIGKTVFLTKEEAEAKMKGGAE